MVRAYQYAARVKGLPQALGRSLGGLSTKIHLAVDGSGQPLIFFSHSDQANDAPQCVPLLEINDLVRSCGSGEMVLVWIVWACCLSVG